MSMEVDRDIKLKDLYSHTTENHTTIHRRDRRGGGGWDNDCLSYLLTVNDDHLSYLPTINDDHLSYFPMVDDDNLLFKPTTVSRDLVSPNVVEGGVGSVDG